ncbi:ArsC/Spx/MgsR family protein, partial [Acinetobacter baumannii]
MASTYTLYGIPNCSSVKKARTWFDEQQLAYTFVDFKKTPPNAELIKLWLKDVDWNELVNRKGTTYRGLSDTDK